MWDSKDTTVPEHRIKHISFLPIRESQIQFVYVRKTHLLFVSLVLKCVSKICEIKKKEKKEKPYFL